MKMAIQFLLVGLAGSLGAMLRYAIALLLNRPSLPVGTLLINITGSFFLGWLMAATDKRDLLSETARIAIAVGFIGTYTTFSTYMFESDKMLWGGQTLRGIAYISASIFLGLLAVRAGVLLGQKI